MEYSRWQKLMSKFAISSNEQTYLELVKCYGERHRYYHSVKHIDAVLSHLDKVSEFVERAHEVELALWFHDAIYKPFSSTNELDSANWAISYLAENGVSDEVSVRIRNLIMATLHTTEVGNAEEEVIVDIDLSILGCTAEIYEQFEKNVRKEYRLVPYFLYRKKRKEILQRFLSRDRIFHTDYFYQRYEYQARINIKNAIGNL